jgi:hypothetical protein
VLHADSMYPVIHSKCIHKYWTDRKVGRVQGTGLFGISSPDEDAALF